MTPLRLAVIAFAALSLSACIVAPDNGASAQLVAPPNFTPRSVAGQAEVAQDNLTAAQQAAAQAQAYNNEVQAAVMEATAQAQATIDNLNRAILQQAATATAQSMSIAATATKRADDILAVQQADTAKVQATQTAVSIEAAIEATRQVAHERETAFNISASQNKADQDRVKNSADIMQIVYILLFIGAAAIALVMLNKVAGVIVEWINVKALQARLVTTGRGDYSIKLLPNGAVELTPVYQISGPIIDQDEEDQDEPEMPSTIEKFQAQSATQVITVSKGSREYQLSARAGIANACELLMAAIDYLDSIGRDGQAAVWLPGCKSMGWNASTHDLFKKPIARYFDSKPGKGSRLIGYASLSQLYTAVKSGKAEIDVYGRDIDGNPIALLPD